MPVEIVCECGRPIKLSNSAVAHHLASLRRRRRGWTKGRKREPLEDRRYREGNQWMREQYVQLGRRLSELFGANVSSNSWEYDVSALRRAMKLTQKEFGHRFGVRKMTVADWEHNRKFPGKRHRKRLLEMAKMVAEVAAEERKYPVRF